MDTIGFNPDSNQPEPKQSIKKPVLLIILLVLSSIYVFFGLVSSTKSIVSGPLTEEQLEEGFIPLYTLISNAEEQGSAESLVNMLHLVMDYSAYVNNNSFYLNAMLLLLTYIIGAAAIYFMYNMRKTGFHLYVLYSFMPVIAMYLVSPSNLIPNIYIVFYLFIAVFFALLYGLNLKKMR